MCIRRGVLFAVACMLPVSAALACGPGFPQNLLEDRKASLLDLPDGTFDFEAAHLLPAPADHLLVVDAESPDDATRTRTKAEAVGVTADESKKIAAMRAAPDSDAATIAGAGLAPELLDYTLGAIAFKTGNKQVANDSFERVLALSPPQRARRGLWAQYMLGRMQAAGNDTDFAIASFGQLRARALDGAADPLALAVASLGEQARVHWHRGNVAAAVALYAQQAAHGSRDGRASLLFVARSLLAHADLLDKALDDPLSQRLLAAYFYTRSNEFAQDWPLAGEQTDSSAAGASAEPKPSGSPAMDLAGFIATVQRHGLDHFDGADRMAAGAYRAGRYPLAAQLAAKSTTPLAAWVRAKLALRAGDQNAALREYAQAAKGFPVDESWVGENLYNGAVESPLCRVETERGILALGRSDYTDAMARLYAGAKEHWPDAAYVAERVLTVDELKKFVESNAPFVSRKVPVVQGGYVAASPSQQLRALLARRLLRVGRDAEALAYFDDPVLHAKAVALVAARRAGNAWSRTARAEAMFRQAQLTRGDGMELLGSELAPDAAMFDGGFGMDAFPLTPANYVSPGEPARVAASAIVPDVRFHYRHVAADLAVQAATMVPARSQAYAALLCQATSWVIDTDTKRATAFYRQYLHDGPHVAWGKDFGRVCPAPDFAAARWVPWKQRYRAMRHWAKHGWPFALCGLGLGVIVLAIRRRRSKTE